ncbi:translation initiation factor IF-2 [Candidatus Nomurabacteria bacterium]|nr:translation initiation factor IF-2 [Candidatus Nomurabacteria bacterium]
MQEKNEKQNNMVTRPPVVAVMGHIDHGKSTLLDYIRKTNVVDKETGGITQAISAYEVSAPTPNESGSGSRPQASGKITFLDTPGHEAFSKMRERGAEIADIAILVVSAEDGVKPQTVEAWKTIVESGIPAIVAINKIDKPGANIEKTKTELSENGIYLENYGGTVPFAEISAKTGAGVDNLLSLILILAEVENFTGNPKEDASGFVIEVNLDPRRGIMATLIIKNGTLKKGMTVAVEGSLCSTRIMENFKGDQISEATFSSPVRIVGFDKMPRVGAQFKSFQKKSDAEKFAKDLPPRPSGTPPQRGGETPRLDKEGAGGGKKIIPIILKADVSGSIEAIEKEISKIKNKTDTQNAEFRIVAKGIGPISESDIKSITSDLNVLVIGFNVKTDKNAFDIALQRGITISHFDIIYKMTEWLETQMEEKRPRVETLETTGRAKIIRAFSRTKERQILGGKVTEGQINLNSAVRIMRRDFEIGRGKIVNLEKMKAKTSAVEEGAEFGMMIESKIEIVAGDVLESFTMTRK